MVSVDKRIPNQNAGTPAILSENNPDTLRFNPYDYILSDKVASKFLAAAKPYSGTSGSYSATTKDPSNVIQDILELTSVSIVSYKPFYDSVTKALTYDVVLKIMNTSSSPSDTIGVEARKFVPGA